MTDTTSREVCPECGARLKAGSDRCDLCGASLSQEPVDESIVPVQDLELPAEAAPAAPESTGGPFCNQCGWRNPPGARFCSACGTQLQNLAAFAREVDTVGSTLPPTAAPAVAPPNISRKVGLIVASSILLVVALFMATAVSRDRAKPEPAAEETTARSTSGGAPGVEAAHENLPLPEDVAARVRVLESEIAGLSGDARARKQEELVQVYLSANRVDRAALEQAKVAEATGATVDWVKAGDLNYAWMESIDGQHKMEVAARTVAAYQKALEKDPDNLDARANMAWAYQFDPKNAMEAINQTNVVLGKSPDHLRANFNKGVFLIQINRLDQAKAQFERVSQLAPEGSPEADRAKAALEAIADMQAQRPAGGAAMPGS